MATSLDRWREPATACGLFLLSFALYSQTWFFDFQYTWDDGVYVYSNPFITAFTLDNIIGLFDRPYEGLYGPVQMLSYMLDYQFWGLDPFGYHLSNVIFHAANTVLAYQVLRRLTGHFLLALFAAVLFAVHPLNVENIAWIAERKTLVSAFFLLASVLFYLRYRSVDSPRISAYIGAIICFVLAVFAKATVVGLPLVLGFYELLMRDKDDRRYRPLIAFLGVSVIGALVTLGVTVEKDVVASGQEISAAMLFGAVYPTMLVVWWEYIRLLLFPVGLSAYYVPLIRGILDPFVLLALLAWIAVLDRVFFRASREVRFWFLWAAILFAPTSGLLPWVVYYADRYMYLPAIGLYVIAGMGLGWLFRKLAQNRPTLAGNGERLALVGMVLAALVYGGLAFQRSAVWASELALWENTTRMSPQFSDGHVNLGAANLRLGRFDEAEAAYRRGFELGNPTGEVGLRVVEGRRRLMEAGGPESK